MYTYQQTLADDIKREVLAELRQRNDTNIPPYAGRANNTNYGTPDYPGSLDPPAADRTQQAIKDSVKSEIMAEVRMQRADQIAQSYGLGNSLSDQKIQQAIDARYRTIDNMKEDIKKELLAMQKMDAQRIRDPHISQIAGTLADEAKRQGIPLDQVTRSLDRKVTTNSGLMGRLTDMINTGQRRGFLYGMGTMCLLHLFWPSARNNLRSVAVRSVEEGISMVDRAKTFVKGHQQPTPSQQDPPADFSNIAPIPPPDIDPSPDGDNITQ